jgi:hypothetical protein
MAKPSRRAAATKTNIHAGKIAPAIFPKQQSSAIFLINNPSSIFKKLSQAH